jgi:hypothetical protein
MHLPVQAAAVTRRRGTWSAWPAGVSPSQQPNTCNCSGDSTYNQCGVTRNGCSPGYHPECNPGPYNCGCTCKPA